MWFRTIFSLAAPGLSAFHGKFESSIENVASVRYCLYSRFFRSSSRSIPTMAVLRAWKATLKFVDCRFPSIMACNHNLSFFTEFVPLRRRTTAPLKCDQAWQNLVGERNHRTHLYQQTGDRFFRKIHKTITAQRWLSWLSIGLPFCMGVEKKQTSFVS